MIDVEDEEKDVATPDNHTVILVTATTGDRYD